MERGHRRRLKFEENKKCCGWRQKAGGGSLRIPTTRAFLATLPSAGETTNFGGRSHASMCCGGSDGTTTAGSRATPHRKLRGKVDPAHFPSNLSANIQVSRKSIWWIFLRCAIAPSAKSPLKILTRHCSSRCTHTIC